MRPAAFTIGKSKFQREREEREARLRREGATGDVDEKIEVVGGLPERMQLKLD
jgi:hypothetical protein